MSGFQFEYTYPIIDENLSIIEDNIYDEVSSFLVDQFPILSYHDAPLKALSEALTNNIFNNIKLEIENIRSYNSDMRDAAEDQIIGLEETISDLKLEIEDLKKKINEIKEKENN